jgi:serine phosphatase RsbU (regulator of sigma subunit)
MLVRADGATLMLEHPAELLLGVAPQRRRTDHELLLGGRDTLVLFTDGLVEHRQAAIDQGLARVAAALAATGAGPLEQLCDVLLAQVGEHPHDDVAVLAVRV